MLPLLAVDVFLESLGDAVALDAGDTVEGVEGIDPCPCLRSDSMCTGGLSPLVVVDVVLKPPCADTTLDACDTDCRYGDAVALEADDMGDAVALEDGDIERGEAVASRLSLQRVRPLGDEGALESGDVVEGEWASQTRFSRQGI